MEEINQEINQERHLPPRLCTDLAFLYNSWLFSIRFGAFLYPVYSAYSRIHAYSSVFL